jgi:hypothetical protein
MNAVHCDAGFDMREMQLDGLIRLDSLPCLETLTLEGIFIPASE